jgi:hypothetical protein
LHEEKSHLLFNHFHNILGTKEQRKAMFNWAMLDLPRLPGHHCFNEEEVRGAILNLHAKKAPGPDDFTGAFYHGCWDIIKCEIMAAFNCFYNLTTSPLSKLNNALLTLLPKKEVAEFPRDFRPISLIHSVAKLFTKVLAGRLSRYIDRLVPQAQSAFIKRQCIQDNFLYVRNLARAYHRKKLQRCCSS